ncbi:hypothetical protein LPJ64_001821 [Coemansia asiatica]|uniref:SWIRM domain-containing protein n=1 Tax=Coemansia asiatica TaxID=1052880 RepID=A0A9W7XMR0_9FUNG|nr:hypothetical protein LPJ64_001821 [Coemansia asiatica]
MISSYAISPEPALTRKNDGYIRPNMAILAPSVPSIGPHFTTKESWTAACTDATSMSAKQKQDAPKAAAQLQATSCDAKNSQNGENHSYVHNRIISSADRRIAGSSNRSKSKSKSRSNSKSGRVDKRKLRRPTRSLPARDSGCDSRCFYTVKMSFVDDYQRNPTAYSRALMDTERPHSGSYRSSPRHIYALPLVGTNAGSMHSGGALSAPASTTSFSHRINPPLLPLSPSAADPSNDGMLFGNNQLKRVHSSSTLHAQSSREKLESSQLHPSERSRPPELRKSMSAAIQRLFPSLKVSINALATSSSQACADNNKTAFLTYKNEPTRCSSAIMRPPGISAPALEASPNQLSSSSSLSSLSSLSLSSATSAKNIRLPLHHHHSNNSNSNHQTLPYQRYPRHSVRSDLSSSRSSTPLSTNSGATGIDQFITDDLSREIFQLEPKTASCSVKWAKAAPMDVSECAYAEYLTLAERDCCSILRLYPEQYLTIKQSLVRAGRTLPPGTFKKRDAQKLCRVDVNKTSKVFEWFCKLGWIPQASTKPNFGNSNGN